MVYMDIISPVCLLVVLYTAQVNCDDQKLCDIRTWYLTLVSDDVFNTDLTPGMLQLKQSIETTVLNTPDTPDDKKHCQILKMYNSMLKEKYNYDYESKHVNEKPSSASDPNTEEKGKRTESKDSYSENDSNTIQNKGNEKHEKGDDTGSSQEKQNASKEDGEQGDTVSVGEIPNPSNDADGNSEEEQIDIDETELLDDETDVTDEKETYNSGEDNGDDKPDDDRTENETDAPADETDRAAEENDKSDDVFVTRSVPIGVCWSFGCLQSDVFDVFGVFGRDDIPDTSENDIDEEEPTDEDRDDDVEQVERKDLLKGSKSDQVRVSITQEQNSFQSSCVFEKHSCRRKCYYLFSSRYCIVGYIDKAETERKLADTPKDSSTKTNTLKLNAETIKSDSNLEDISETRNDSKDVVKEIEREHANLFEEISDVTNKLDQLEKMSKTSTGVKGEKDSTAQKMSVDEFEKMIHETTSQYAQKIQALEMMIMKLENSLLVEKLNKQNHSSTITRLENLILKLENDFLKLNTQYDDMKTENENISKRQNHYLEIAYKKQKPTCKQLELPDKSAKTSELLSQHQSKIIELTDILRNQSDIIRVIKDRYNSLEDQNRMLHQMIMNQTIFMTSIIQTMQDLTTQNSKNKDEIEALKVKLANTAELNTVDLRKATPKDNILDSLDKYAVDDKINVGESNPDDGDDDDDAKQEDADINLKRYLEHKSAEEFITNWCPAKNDSCPVCFYKTVLSNYCFPFRHLVWGTCGVLSTNVPVNKENTLKKVETETAQHKGHETIDLATKSGDIKQDTKIEKMMDYPLKDDENVSVKKHDNEENEEENSVKDSASKVKEITKENSVSDGSSSTKDEGRLHGDTLSTGQQSLEGKIEDKNNKITDNDQLSTPEQTTNERLKQKVSNENKDISHSLPNKDITKTDTKKQNDSEGNGGSIDNSKDNSKDNVEENKTKIIKEDKESQTDSKSQEDSNKTKIIKEDKESQTDSKSQEDSKKTNNGRKQQPQQKVNPNNKGTEKQPKDSSKAEKKTAVKERKVPANLDKEKPNAPKDCYDYYKRGNKKDGIFKINPVGLNGIIDVFCDMKNGGWTVIQRRQDGSMKFFQEWKDYKKGFGGLYGEHWLGNDNIHFLTNQNYYELRVDLMDWDKNKKYAEYSYFLVENEENGYRINIDGFTGDAGDGLSKHNGHKFSTKDVDNDKVEKEFGGSCAIRFKGAGWYYKCYASNLNGKYYKGGVIPDKKYDGVTWKPWTGPNYSLKKVEMKVKPVMPKK